MKIFLTGGTGFLGAEVARQLLAAGCSVRAMVRDRFAKLPTGVEAVETSLSAGGAMPLAEAIRGVDVVVHLAGKVSREPRDASEMHFVHVEGTRALLEAMSSAKVRRMILASTSGVIAASKTPRIATEADDASLEVIGRWPYYVSKRLQEQEVLRWNHADRIEAIVLSPSLLLGPGDDRLSSTGDVHRIASGRYPAITDGTVAMVDVRDAARAFVSALSSGRRGERYLLNGANLTVRAWVDRIAIAAGVAPPKLRLSEKWALRGARLLEGVAHATGRDSPIETVAVEMGCHHWGCSSAKAEQELGFTARDPQQTIEATVRDLERRGLVRKR